MFKKVCVDGTFFKGTDKVRIKKANVVNFDTVVLDNRTIMDKTETYKIQDIYIDSDYTPPEIPFCLSTGELYVERVFRDNQLLAVLDDEAIKCIAASFNVPGDKIFYTPGLAPSCTYF